MLKEDVIKQVIFELYSENEKDTFTECANILCIYFQNIIKHPTEEKYHSIKSSNKTFASKVGCVRGAEAVILKLGFDKMDNE